MKNQKFVIAKQCAHSMQTDRMSDRIYPRKDRMSDRIYPRKDRMFPALDRKIGFFYTIVYIHKFKKISIGTY